MRDTQSSTEIRLNILYFNYDLPTMQRGQSSANRQPPAGHMPHLPRRWRSTLSSTVLFQQHPQTKLFVVHGDCCRSNYYITSTCSLLMTCPKCNGSGSYPPGNQYHMCSKCMGTGHYTNGASSSITPIDFVIIVVVLLVLLIKFCS